MLYVLRGERTLLDKLEEIATGQHNLRKVCENIVYA